MKRDLSDLLLHLLSIWPEETSTYRAALGKSKILIYLGRIEEACKLYESAHSIFGDNVALNNNLVSVDVVYGY